MELLMYAAYASIIASIAMCLVSAFDLDVSMKRSKRPVTLKHIGAYVFLNDVVTLSDTKE